MTETRQVELDQDEIRFITALRDADEAAMISVFAKVNGTKNLDVPEPSAEKLTEVEKDDLANITLEFITAWKADDTDALQSLVDQKRGAPLPMSYVARERSRDRQIPPDIRFRCLSVLEEFQTLIQDTAYRVMDERPHHKQMGNFEEDATATEMLRAICDYLDMRPDINQVSNEYHVRWFYDLEWDSSKKTTKVFDRNGNTQAIEDLSGDED